VNDIIGRIIESGILTYLKSFSPEAKKFLKENPNTSKTVADDYYVFTMINIQSAFYLFLFGHRTGSHMVSNGDVVFQNACKKALASGLPNYE
jgi:hypothetical protein